jgi:ubiquinone/menaquinone biosynthesis C-methylase UbiE
MTPFSLKNFQPKLLTAKSFGLARSLHYFLQFQALNGLSQLLPFAKMTGPLPTPSQIQTLAREVESLHNTDAQNIDADIYPLEVLKPESPLEHALRVPKIFYDGIKIHWRRHSKKTKEFSVESDEKRKDTPEYFQRNFHFQTDGYLSENSAKLYDHQVELLFAGCAGAMRRQVIRPLKEALRQSADTRLAQGWKTGEGLTFLELGCGTGTMTKFMKLAFPKAKIVASDVSAPYLKMARKKMGKFESVDFVQTAAETTPFQDQGFDVVYTVYLFHELPVEARKNVLRESLRLLKPDGLFTYVDSLQLGDNPELDDALKQFPKDFHEPFYTNYIKTPMRDLTMTTGLSAVSAGHAFLSRYEVYKKSLVGTI